MNNDMKVFCGVLASGMGLRFSSNSDTPKQFKLVSGTSLFDMTLNNIVSSKLFDAVIVALLPEYENKFNSEVKSRFNSANVDLYTVHGGFERIDSILAVINEVEKHYKISDKDIFCLVDANRPLVDKDIYSKVILGASKHNMCCPAKPLVDGVGLVDGDKLIEIPEKSNLISIQTPEAFNLSVFNKIFDKVAHANKLGIAEIFIEEGITPKIIKGNHKTYKVTYPGDLLVIEALSKSTNE